MKPEKILKQVQHVRDAFHDKHMHVFGVGGTATLHIAALLGVDTVDSAGWRNRAARGIIILPGSGERVIAELGNWRGRRVSEEEQQTLLGCECPACREHGMEGLEANKSFGFYNRATHNLWVLLKEKEWLDTNLANDTYVENYKDHLHNTIYKPLIDKLVLDDE
ncbi:MAG: hypothetical protein CUN55_17235 [Phototrophicales bacterium]|nr:MAG: hypothetical protein CUN55_17235 [Phototrophicales bacterium]